MPTLIGSCAPTMGDARLAPINSSAPRLRLNMALLPPEFFAWPASLWHGQSRLPPLASPHSPIAGETTRSSPTPLAREATRLSPSALAGEATRCLPLPLQE